MKSSFWRRSETHQSFAKQQNCTIGSPRPLEADPTRVIYQAEFRLGLKDPSDTRRKEEAGVTFCSNWKVVQQRA
jgi:hypothetical protein